MVCIGCESAMKTKSTTWWRRQSENITGTSQWKIHPCLCATRMLKVQILIFWNLSLCMALWKCRTMHMDMSQWCSRKCWCSTDSYNAFLLQKKRKTWQWWLSSSDAGLLKACEILNTYTNQCTWYLAEVLTPWSSLLLLLINKLNVQKEKHEFGKVSDLNPLLERQNTHQFQTDKDAPAHAAMLCHSHGNVGFVNCSKQH